MYCICFHCIELMLSYVATYEITVRGITLHCTIHYDVIEYCITMCYATSSYVTVLYSSIYYVSS